MRALLWLTCLLAFVSFGGLIVGLRASGRATAAAHAASRQAAQVAAVGRSNREAQTENHRAFCRLFVRNHHVAELRLANARRYLAQPSISRTDALTLAIAATLPQLRADVKATRVAVVCTP